MAPLLFAIIAGTLLVGGVSAADVTKQQYCYVLTITQAPIKTEPSDDAPPRYIVPPGTALWVIYPAFNNYLRIPETPPYPSRSGWIRENYVRIVSCASDGVPTQVAQEMEGKIGSVLTGSAR